MKLMPRNYFLDDLFDDFVPSIREQGLMKCDVYELNNEYNIEVDIPGYDKNEVTIEYNEDYLTIKAEKESKVEEENKKYYHNERRYGKVERSFYLKGIDKENIKAKMENGTLYITIPKQAEIDAKKTIEIE